MRDKTLALLYIELDAVEAAMKNIYFRYEQVVLTKRRAELLGNIKKLEREYNA